MKAMKSSVNVKPRADVGGLDSVIESEPRK